MEKEEFKEPKLFGKDDDGFYKGKIEEIATGRTIDTLFLSNRKPNLWVLSIISGYRQIGRYDLKKPHHFKEGDLVIVEKRNNKVISVGVECGEVCWSIE